MLNSTNTVKANKFFYKMIVRVHLNRASPDKITKGKKLIKTLQFKEMVLTAGIESWISGLRSDCHAHSAASTVARFCNSFCSFSASSRSY